MTTVPIPKRGEIWQINFDPSIGAEIQKVRPAVVISVDTIGRLPLRMVVPVTDWKPHYAGFPWFVELPATTTNGLTNDS
jgi:mRNA interferase MazF